VIDGSLDVRVRDLRSQRRWLPLASSPLDGGRDFAWLGEERLLLATAPVPVDLVALGGSPVPRAVAVPIAGLQRLDVRTGRLAPWLYSRGTEVLRICRAPGTQDRYAVGLGRTKAHSALPPMARRLEIVDGRTKARRELRIPAPSHVAGFSPDGRTLLLLMLRRTPWRDAADAVTLDVASGRRRLIARDVTEAAWLSP
jgi:hypothetical protein